MSKSLAAQLILCLCTIAHAQPKSAVQFYDTTGSNPTAQFGWRGTVESGELYLQAPMGNDAATFNDGNLDVSGTVNAQAFTGNGAGLDGVAQEGHSHTLSEIAPQGIAGADIADGTVGTEDLRDSSVTTHKIRNGTIVDADIAAVAGIKGTKIDGDFGTRDLKTGGQIGAWRSGGTDRSYRLYFDTFGGTDRLTLGAFEGDAYKGAILQSEFDPRYTILAGRVHIDTLSTGHTIAPYSDERLKTNRQPIAGAVTALARMEGFYFEWLKSGPDGESMPEGTQIGLSAQQVEKVFPEAVETDSDGYKHLDYAELVPVLVNAIKEQQRDIEELRKELAEIRSH